MCEEYLCNVTQPRPKLTHSDILTDIAQNQSTRTNTTWTKTTLWVHHYAMDKTKCTALANTKLQPNESCARKGIIPNKMQHIVTEASLVKTAILWESSSVDSAICTSHTEVAPIVTPSSTNWVVLNNVVGYTIHNAVAPTAPRFS